MSLLHGRELLKNKGRWAIGSGSNVSISDKCWLASREMAIVKEGANIHKVRDLIDPPSHSWNVGKLRQTLEATSAIDALKTPIGWTTSEDILFWPLTKDGNYSTKS